MNDGIKLHAFAINEKKTQRKAIPHVSEPFSNEQIKGEKVPGTFCLPRNIYLLPYSKYFVYLEVLVVVEHV